VNKLHKQWSKFPRKIHRDGWNGWTNGKILHDRFARNQPAAKIEDAAVALPWPGKMKKVYDALDCSRCVHVI